MLARRLALLEGGHVPASPNEVIREVLDWIDLYLGPVAMSERSDATRQHRACNLIGESDGVFTRIR